MQMKAKPADWYKHCWTLDIKNQSWVEDTERQVDFIIRALGLTKQQRILDLACGYGRHALSLARRGYRVTGVDLTAAYIADAKATAKAEGLTAEFIQADIREIAYREEFDAVLSLADGAIGYLETDAENLKIFDRVAAALKLGGHHFMDVCNGEHAALYFPKTSWETGEHALALAQFDWDPATHRMLFGGCDLPYGVPTVPPAIPAGDPTRLYTTAELQEIFAARGMQLLHTYCDYTGRPASPKEFQLLVDSVKLG